MKLFILLMFVSINAYADVVFKVGGWPGSGDDVNAGEAHGLVVAIESNKRHSVSPNFTRISNDYGKFDGLGLDYVYKPLNNGDANLRLAVGGIAFRDPLNDGERMNFHLGVGFELNRVILSYDIFGNGDDLLDRVTVDQNVVSHMLSVGFRFE